MRNLIENSMNEECDFCNDIKTFHSISKSSFLKFHKKCSFYIFVSIILTRGLRANLKLCTTLGAQAACNAIRVGRLFRVVNHFLVFLIQTLLAEYPSRSALSGLSKTVFFKNSHKWPKSGILNYAHFAPEPSIFSQMTFYADKRLVHYHKWPFK